MGELEHLLPNLGTAWKRAAVAPRKALQELVFLDDVPVRDKAVRTPHPASVFAALPGIHGQKNEKVALTGIDRLQRRLTVVSNRWFELGTAA